MQVIKNLHLKKPNDTEQHIPKSISTKDPSIKLFNENKRLYLGTDTSGAGLRASLLQVRKTI